MSDDLRALNAMNVPSQKLTSFHSLDGRIVRAVDQNWWSTERRSEYVIPQDRVSMQQSVWRQASEITNNAKFESM